MLDEEFKELVKLTFPAGLRPEQVDTLRMFYFAGAAAGVSMDSDDVPALRDELSDRADAWGASGVM